MYVLIIGLCLVLSGLDICLMVSKKVVTTDSERELADQEQMKYFKRRDGERKLQ